ncbi:MAG TPA: glycosyltransferase family 4 protein [Dissulfurispiraceae bacterium]
MPDIKANICHIISGDLWAGAEAQACALVKSLAKSRRLRLHVITFNHGPLAEKLGTSGIHVEVIDEGKENAARMLRRIYLTLGREHTDILHTHGYKETFLGGLAARACGVRAIIRTHHGKGVIDGTFSHRLAERWNAAFFEDRSIAVSGELRGLLDSRGSGARNMAVIHNGIPCEEIKPSAPAERVREGLEIRGDALVIGTMGRMVPVKGHKYFLEGAKDVLARHRETVFVIAGGGPLMDEMHGLAESLGIRDRVRLTGFTGSPFDVMNIFDIFTLPSLHEGIPMALLEAMAMGKPIIATGVGGIPEVVADRTDGLLIPPTDARAFASACLELIGDPAMRARLAKNAKGKVMAEYDIGRTAEKVLKLYGEFLGHEDPVYMGC